MCGSCDPLVVDRRHISTNERLQYLNTCQAVSAMNAQAQKRCGRVSSKVLCSQWYAGCAEAEQPSHSMVTRAECMLPSKWQLQLTCCGCCLPQIGGCDCHGCDCQADGGGIAKCVVSEGFGGDS